jgi:hypothetical protein
MKEPRLSSELRPEASPSRSPWHPPLAYSASQRDRSHAQFAGIQRRPLHEVVHARRRDNLIRLLYELSLCTLWFHPLVWLAGARMAVYRELSCDESGIRRAHGQALVSALAKLAVPERALFLQATASSHLSHRCHRVGHLWDRRS